MKAVSRVVFALLVLGTVTALAQPDAGAPPAGTGSGSSAPPAPKVAAPTTPAEMTTRTEILSTQMQGDYQQALRLKDVAKKQKDVIKLNCVNDRLVEMKAQLNLADTTKAQITGSTADPSKVSPEASAAFLQLSAKADAIRELREQAGACIGVELSKGESGLEVTKPDIPDDPATVDPYGTDLPSAVIEPPGYASAFH